MGLFKDFKEDLSQAVNELVPGGEATLEEVKEENTDELVVDTMNEDSQPSITVDKVQELDTLLSSANNQTVATPVSNDQITDDVSLITSGTTLTGDLSSTGSFDIQGTINGNITCNGKLTVTGTINGNSNASEIFANAANIEGEITSNGTVKIGTGSVIIGNINATSAVIAGAVKGDIDVTGPVVVDTSAVIMGNIKSRSVQINNGAVIEGFCSQCYADIDVSSLFNK